MDVTTQLLKKYQTYSVDPKTNLAGTSLSKAEIAEVRTVPSTLEYSNSVGLSKGKNYFLKVKLNIIGNTILKEYMEPGYLRSDLDFFGSEDDTGYVSSSVDQVSSEQDSAFATSSTPALTLPAIGLDAYLSIELKNLNTSNIYIDSNVDVRLYTSEHEEHPYDLMYVKPLDFFYVGVHARNTRNLPYNIQIDIGNEYVMLESISDKNYVMRTSERPS
jgi:hypothetical protein